MKTPSPKTISSGSCLCFIQRQDVFSWIRHILRFTAMYPLTTSDAGQSQSHRMAMQILDVLLEIVLYFCPLHVVVLFIVTLYKHLDNNNDIDLDFVIDCFIQVVLFSWTIVVKVYFRRINPGTLNRLMDSFNEKYRTRSAMGVTYVTMEKALSHASTFFRYYMYLCFAGTTFWGLLPLVYNDRGLPLPCWYPFDYKAPLIYEMVYFVQFVAQLQLASAYGASSGLFVALVILICGQYDMLFCSLKNLLATAYIMAAKDPNELTAYKDDKGAFIFDNDQYNGVIEQVTPSVCYKHMTDFGRRMRTEDTTFATANGTLKAAFRPCVTLQRYIFSLQKQMERLYCPIWFFKFGEMTTMLCLVGFASVKTVNTSVIQLISLGQYLFLISLEVGLIFYFGEMLLQSSQRCGEALMRSPWHLYMAAMKSDILFFLLNSQRAFRLTAGKIFTLDLASGKSTVTMAFSFLTLLQQMDQREENQ